MSPTYYRHFFSSFELSPKYELMHSQIQYQRNGSIIPPAIANITHAIPLSIIFQDSGFSSTLESLLAPYPRAKKNRNEASAAPNANQNRLSAEYLLDAPPIRMIVSRYTWGLRNVNASTVPIVGPKLNASSFPRDIPIGFIEDLTLSIP